MSDDLLERARFVVWLFRECDAIQLPHGPTEQVLTGMIDRIKELEAKLAQQDDLVQAAVAAALREAAGIASYHQDWGDVQSAILALITPDAQAALDRVVAAERERGCWAGRSCGGSKAEIDAALAAFLKR